MAARPLRLMIYDRTCGRAGSWPGLSDTWRIGGALYRALGRFDAWTGVESWREALTWLATAGGDRTIGEIQYWGHGTWGRALIARDVLDASAVRPHHPLCAPLEQVRERLDRSGPSPALWWFRTCETFGREAGHDFARAWNRVLRLPRRGTHVRDLGIAERLTLAGAGRGTAVVRSRGAAVGRGEPREGAALAVGRGPHDHVPARRRPRRLLTAEPSATRSRRRVRATAVYAPAR